MRLTFASLILLLTSSIYALAQEPSFDCTRAESSAEKLICSDAQLALLDLEVNRLFKLARDGQYMSDDRRKDLVAYQRGWIKGRDDCWKSEDLRQCIVDSHVIRIHDLRRDYADARSDDDAGISSGPLALVCEGFDPIVSVAFVQTDPQLAFIGWGQMSIALSRVMSGSGARYEGDYFDGHYQLWIKGDEATLDMPEREPFNCMFDEIG